MAEKYVINDFDQNNVQGVVVYISGAGVFRPANATDFQASSVTVGSVGLTGQPINATGVNDVTVLNPVVQVGITGQPLHATGVNDVTVLNTVNVNSIPQTTLNGLSIYRNLNLGTGGANIKGLCRPPPHPDWSATGLHLLYGRPDAADNNSS